MLKGKPVDARRGDRRRAAADRRARSTRWRWCRAGARNEELAAFKRGARRRASPRSSRRTTQPQPGERVEDDLLIRADKNPNTAGGARAVRAHDDAPRVRRRTPTWCWSGARASTSRACRAGAKIIFLNAYLQPENGHADVFIPISIQTERARPLHELRGRGERVRAVLREAGRRSPTPRRCSPRSRPRRRRTRMIQDLVVYARLHRLRARRCC